MNSEDLIPEDGGRPWWADPGYVFWLVDGTTIISAKAGPDGEPDAGFAVPGRAVRVSVEEALAVADVDIEQLLKDGQGNGSD